MIKEKEKREPDITLVQEIKSYIKTAGISFIVAVIFTVLLSFHSRSEMIKNLYANKVNRVKIEHDIAQQIVAHSDLLSTLEKKNSAICLRVGDLYEAAGDIEKAEYAYYLAIQKSEKNAYSAYLKYITVIVAQNKIKDAEMILNGITDINELGLIRMKTRANIIIGDKYYSEGRFLKAASAYEKAEYYYNRLKKRDRFVHESIKKRILSAYVETASVIIQNGGSLVDAERFLKKALHYDPDNLKIQYRLALVYADLDPIRSIDYFEPLLMKIPQDIRYSAFEKALIKAANIMDIQKKSIQAKYYRYRIHSLNLYLKNKVVYKDDIDIELKSFIIKKRFFKYKLKPSYKITNVSNDDIKTLHAEFVLKKDNKIKQKIDVKCVNNKIPLYANGGETGNIGVSFDKNIYTKRELQHYTIDVYLYKDPRFKTLVLSHKIPNKSVYSSRRRGLPHL